MEGHFSEGETVLLTFSPSVLQRDHLIVFWPWCFSHGEPASQLSVFPDVGCNMFPWVCWLCVLSLEDRQVGTCLCCCLCVHLTSLSELRGSVQCPPRLWNVWTHFSSPVLSDSLLFDFCNSSNTEACLFAIPNMSSRLSFCIFNFFFFYSSDWIISIDLLPSRLLTLYFCFKSSIKLT